MSNPLPPVALAAGALGALQARGAPPQQPTPARVAPAATTKPLAARADFSLRRGQYLDVVV